MKKDKNYLEFAPGKVINCQAYKYNGDLYRQWNGVKVLKNTPKHYVLFMHKTKVKEKYNHSWTYKDYVLWFLPKNSMYNAIILLKPKQNYVYVNIAMPPVAEDNTIKFIDLDLDVKSYAKKNISVVDIDEFKFNSKRFNYPEKLKEMSWEALEEVVNKYDNSEYFFNPTVIDYYISSAKKDKSIPQSFRQSAGNNNKKDNHLIKQTKTAK